MLSVSLTTKEKIFFWTQKSKYLLSEPALTCSLTVLSKPPESLQRAATYKQPANYPYFTNSLKPSNCSLIYYMQTENFKGFPECTEEHLVTQ
jgi:hypothetical protein